MGAREGIPRDLFTTEGAPQEERFARWREAISVYFDVERAAPLPDRALSSRLESYLIGETGFVRCDSHGQRFLRRPGRYALDDLDHYLVQLYVAGASEHRRGAQEVAVRTGDIAIYDLADVHEALTSDSYSNLTLIVPRRRLAPLLRAPDSQQGRTLAREGFAAGVLRDVMLRLDKGAGDIDPRAAAAFSTGLINLCAAAMNEGESVPAGRGALDYPRIYRVRRLMQERLGDPELNPETLADLAGLSRASIYRLFKERGGVQQELFRMRLNRAAAELADPAQARLSVAEIGFRCGFKSPAHFSRLFKDSFGRSPRAFRTERRRFNPQSDGLLPRWFTTLSA
ncbi:MAG: helix-turn-helix domain-containing protein [Marivibrio sp.]|uniref:helix-turn-helix domain-containing protein n=1 Tax=Marivibrio sp. TaxID=2039719 RepID=UPI0032EC4F72